MLPQAINHFKFDLYVTKKILTLLCCSVYLEKLESKTFAFISIFIWYSIFILKCD